MNRPVVLQPGTRTLLKPSRTKSPTHNEPRYVEYQIHTTKYINNAPNYQSTNETYYTQENTMITKHKRKRSMSMKIHLATTAKRQSTSHQTHTTKHHQCTLTLNPPSLQNKTTDVVIQQQSRKLWWWILLVSERCWAHKKWNKIASDIKFVFYSSTITMVHGPINIRFFEGS